MASKYIVDWVVYHRISPHARILRIGALLYHTGLGLGLEPHFYLHLSPSSETDRETERKRIHMIN